MFQHILVPIAFTEKNVRSVEIASNMALLFSAQLTLVHVIEELDLIAPRESKSFYRRLEENARTSMQTFATRVERPGLNLHQKLVYGHRVSGIVQTAEEVAADLIVLSSHRIDPNSGQGWGTISYQVALLAPCPVLLVK
jgi:nucleotide-binding universal stress UspA family protein